MKSCTLFAVLVAALTLATLPTQACLNDRDTLAEEIKGLPEVAQIITGRFERNPPLYYEMRIKRLESEIPAHRDVLNNYDDIAVALDRVHRDDEAIRWEESKRAKLIALNVSATDPATKENWYRYYANCGTCWVHRWLKRGADRTHIEEVQTARDMIAKAIEIKPGAHEWREKYQLLVMDWIINPRDPQTEVPYSLPEYVRNGRAGFGHRKELDEAITGFAGLVVLGGGWESRDVFDTLRVLLQRRIMEHGRHLEALAALRSDELSSKGGISLSEKFGAIKYVPRDRDGLKDENTPVYRKLRAEADAWQARRAAYMMTRLQAGRHPDTDPTFWREWHDSGPPSIPMPPMRWLWLALGMPMGSEGQFVVWSGVGGLILLIVVCNIVYEQRRKRLQYETYVRNREAIAKNRH
ncbi:MAG TPA: hypothetical protein VGK19_18815 [Capsulimonadaceae bacterium]|jgi:hypothetical protein